jgi:hypothetical protein
MTAPLAQASVSTLLASVALFSFTSAAQPGPAQANLPEREIAISGAAEEPPAVVYGAPDVPLVLSFDAPLRKDAAVAVQGADVRAHPFRPDAVVIMPSRSLAAQKSVPVLVPLSDGEVALTLSFSPPRRDSTVRIVRRATSTARSALTGGEVKELLFLAAERALEPGTCANAGATAALRRVKQGKDNESSGEPLVCGGGSFAYLRVKGLRAKCVPASARLTRGEESAEVLLLARTAAPGVHGNRWLVVAWAPVGDGGGFTLEVLAEDGASCLSQPVNLKPSSP